jgi:uncharacterized membrane protein
MSSDTYAWVLVGHVFGFVVWIGGLLACISMLHVHTRVEEGARAALTKTEKSIAMLMDMGAALAIGCGLLLALDDRATGHWPTSGEFSNGAWLHVKLTAVVLGILSAHGMVRAKVKKFSRGEIKPLPRWLPMLVLAAAAVAIALGANQSLLRH